MLESIIKHIYSFFTEDAFGDTDMIECQGVIVSLENCKEEIEEMTPEELIDLDMSLQ